MDSPSRVTIWTDGSCTTKGDRRGGYGVYCVYDDTEITVRHGFWNTTTSRMEMMALLEAVSMINPIVPTDVTVYFPGTGIRAEERDSVYIQICILLR